MKKKFLPTLFALAMCLFLLPTAASALTSANIDSETGFDSYLDADGTLQTEYFYQLTDNVTIEQPLKVKGEITLDLNGHVLRLNSSVYGGEATGSVIEVLAGGNLTLTDSDSTAKHYFYAQSDSDLWRWDADAEGETTQPADGNGKTYHTVTGGVITGGANIDGGGIYIWNGSSTGPAAELSMHGGSIVGCTAVYGGGVYVGNDNAKFTMESDCTGSIAGCAASSEGGGVYVYNAAFFTMDGGSIHDCVVPRLENVSYGRGGGVSNHGTFTMAGGSIENCRVYTNHAKATQTLTDTAEGGGGIYSNDTFTMTGGKIVGCSTEAGSLGDGILLSEGKTLAGVAAPYTLKTADGYVDLTQRCCGNVTYAPCTHERANSDQKCAVCGASLFAEVQRNGVTYHLEKTADSSRNEYALSFALVAPGTTLVKLLGDVTADASWSLASPNLTLELNGHTMTALGIEVLPNGCLTIQDSSADKTGALDLNKIKVQSGGALKLESGKVTVSDPPAGTPEGYADGRITVNGTMTVSGTAEVVSVNTTITVKGNTAPAGLTITGGAVKGSISVESGGELIMTGGKVNIGKEANLEINGGSATISGGSIASLKVNDGNLTITGGTVTTLNVYSGDSATISGGVFAALTNHYGKLVDLLRGGYAYYGGTLNQETGAVTRGDLIPAGSTITTAGDSRIIVAEHACSFTPSGDHQVCGCGRSIAGTQTPVKYLDEHGAPQYCADYKVFDSSYVSDKTAVNNDPTLPQTAKILLLNEGWDGWYLLKESLTIDEDCTVITSQGHRAYFILADGVEVKMKAGLYGNSYSRLEVYAQSTDSNMGKLSFGGSGLSAHSSLIINGGKITVNAKSGRSLNAGTDIGDVYTNGTLTINGGSLTVERPANANAITAGTAAYYGVFSYDGLTVNGGSLTVRIPNAAARNVYGIRTNRAVTLNGGTVTVTAPENSNARNLSASKLTVSGGTMQLKESDLGNPVTVSNGVALAALLDEGQAYWKQVGETGGFLKLADLTSPLNEENASYSIKTCTHSASTGLCAYCGKDLTPMPTPSDPGNSSGSSGGSSSSYPVTAPGTENGSVTVSPKRAQKGDTVTITVTPDSGYLLTDLTVLDKNGNALPLTDNGDGTYSFTMPAGKVDIKPTFIRCNAFTDVPTDAYYYEPVLWAAENGITGGVTETTFAPGQPCTRAQIVTFLYRWAVALGLDVSGGEDTNILSYHDAFDIPEYAIPAFQWAISASILQGNDGALTPNGGCTRAQAVTFLFRFAAANGMDFVTMQELVSGFGDAAQVPGYALSAMNWALAHGIVNGNNGDLLPDQSCTRAQIVTFLYRMSR